MPVGVASPKFDEANDARPTYFVSTTAIAIFLVDHLYVHFNPHPSRVLYFIGICFSGLALIMGVNCIMGCIWHPIPKSRRDDGDLTLMKLDEHPKETHPREPAMFTSLDESTASDDDDPLVDASQVEVRVSIQWTKMLLTLASVGLSFFLLIAWAH